MKAIDLLETMGSIRDRYILEAQEPEKRRLSLTRTLLIAAIISLLLLLVGCAVVYVLQLQDMKLSETTVSEPAWSGPGGEYVPATEYTVTELSLQGYSESPEQQAMLEWQAFTDTYDPDGTLLDGLAALHYPDYALGDRHLDEGLQVAVTDSSRSTRQCLVPGVATLT